MAAEAGHSAVVELLINKKADISAVNNYGGTALMSAAQNGHTDIIQLLFSHGAEVDHAGSEGQTALMLACGMDHLPAVKFLVSKGANVGLKDKAGRTPEDWAKIARRFDIVSYLETLSSGVATNAVPKPIKEISGEFGKPTSFSEKDATSGKEVSCNIIINSGSTSTGSFTPKGMRRYELGARIENLTDSQVELGLGPMDITDDKGKTHSGIIYNGPVYGVEGLGEMVLGEVTGEPSGTLKLTPKGVIEKLRFFVTMPEDAKPKEFAIVIGTKDPKKFRLKFTDGKTTPEEPIIEAPDKKLSSTGGSAEVAQDGNLPAMQTTLANDANARSIQYVQTGYPIYKLAGDIAANAAMLSETYLATPRTIEADAEIDVAKLAQDDLGALIPAECTKYAKDIGGRFAIFVKGKAETKYNLMFQDVAYLKTDKGKHPVMILGYKGCPFSVRELRVLSDISMREPMIVEIASADGNILRAEAASALPFIVASESTTPSFMAVNVQWRFATAGMSFSTTKATYKTSKSGATISFTETGVKLDGVEEVDGPKDVGKDDPSRHPVLYQEGVDVTVTKDGKATTERIAVYGVAGLSFPVKRLEVDRRAKLSKTVIHIEDTKDGLLISSKDSAVPVNMGMDDTGKPGMSFFTHAINVSWCFAKAGMKFDSDESSCEVEKAGATVSFTEDGVKTDGVKMTPKKK
jgi:hypothetical protein